MKVLMITLFLMTCSVHASFFKDHERGWFWYEDPKKEDDDDQIKKEPQKQEEKETEKPEQEPKKSLEMRALESYKQSLEEKKAKALVNPTYENVKDYMTAQKEMMDRSSHFAEVWKRVVLETPDLNTEVKNPSAQYLKHVKEEKQNKETEDLLKEASKDFGLFFFVTKNCAYCKAFAPIVKMFHEKYGFHVFVVSMNGDVDEEIRHLFTDIQFDNGMKDAFGITQAPALMAFNARTEDVIPVSFGATSFDTLVTNFITLLKANRE